MSERPRERLERLGVAALTDVELLALVIGQGSRAASARELSLRLLRQRDLRELARVDPAEWRNEPGIGVAGAGRLSAVFELGRRLAARRPDRGDAVREPREVARYLMARYGDERAEHFGLLMLDGRNRVVREQLVSSGGWSASVVRPREVFRACLLAAAPAVILFHNHPSGDPTPSREDIGITRQLRDGGELLGIRVLDHLVVGCEGFVSLRERGLM